MSLQKRLLVYLLLCAPLVWSVALYFSIDRARLEVNELFDTELIRLTRQVQATLGPLPAPPPVAARRVLCGGFPHLHAAPRPPPRTPGPADQPC